MEAKLYGQNKGGMSINGIIKDYYAFAKEKIEAGDLVEYVNGVAGKTDYGTSEDTQVSAVDHAAYCPMSAVAIDENRVFIAHGSASSSNASNHLYGIVCTINGAKLSFGADTELSTADYSGATISACLLPNGSIFVAHRYSGSYYLYGMVCTVEGTTITAGTDTSIAGSVSSGWAISTCVLPNGNVFIAHSYSDSYHLYGIVVSINGTTITKGTDTSLVTSKNAGYSLATCLLPNGNVFIAHDYGSNHYFYGMVVKTNGTTITKGTDTQLVATQYSGYNKSSLIVLNDGRVFIAYGYGKTNGSTLHGIVCTIEGTTITPGTTNALSTVGYTGDRISACLLANGKIFIAHCNGAGTTSRYLYGIICEVNNATITAGEDTELVSGNNEGSQISSLALQNGSIFVAHSIGLTANLNAQIWGIDEGNNIPTNHIIATDYETQVRKVTTGQFDGIAKTSGTGGDDTGHKDKVSIWTVTLQSHSLVKNGDFENDFNNWYGSYSSGTSTVVSNGYSGNCVKFEVTNPYTDESAVNGFDQKIPMIKGHKYYACCMCKGQSDNYTKMAALHIIRPEKTVYNSGFLPTSNVETWQKISFIVGTVTETGTGQISVCTRIGTTSGDITAGMAMYYDDVKVYDLTTMYGAGNEPTKEWCDANL